MNNIRSYLLAALFVALSAGGTSAAAQHHSTAIPVDDKRVMVIFGDGRTRHSEDGGLTWHEGATPLQASSRPIEAQKMEVRFVSAQGLSYRSVDGGTTWVCEQSPEHSVSSVGESRHTDPRIGVFPNPLKQDGKLSFTVDHPSRVAMRLFDQQGREVAEALIADYSAGEHEVTLDCSPLRSGFYLYSLTIDGAQYSGMIQVVK